MSKYTVVKYKNSRNENKSIEVYNDGVVDWQGVVADGRVDRFLLSIKTMGGEVISLKQSDD